MCGLLGLLALAGSVLLTARSARSQPGDDWKYDVLVLKEGGSVVKGLLVDYQPQAPRVEFRVIQRNPGERARIIPRFYDRAALAEVRPLDAQDRQALLDRLAALDLSGKELARRVRELKLERITWKRDGSPAFRYAAGQFVLESNVKEDLFRRTAVRLSQVYAAYNRALPPRCHATRPTRVLLTGSSRQYQAWLNERGQVFANPAFFDPVPNEIVCGSELERLGTELEQARAANQKVREQVAGQRAELEKLYQGAARVPMGLLRHLDDKTREINRAEAANDRLFEEATRQLWQRLAHEAFHAYLANFVYPPDHEDLPRWLNEGLAQVFETAVFEGEELRIGHADPERLRRVQQALAAGGLVRLTDLLRSTPRQFLVAHGAGRGGQAGGDRTDSERHYLAAWALAMYLAFEHKVLGTDALDAYARATFRKADPVASFCDLVGAKPGELGEVEKAWHAYLRRLQPPGGARRTP